MWSNDKTWTHKTALTKLCQLMPEMQHCFSESTGLPIVAISFAIDTVLDVSVEEEFVTIRYRVDLDWVDLLHLDEYRKTNPRYPTYDSGYWKKQYYFQPAVRFRNVLETMEDEASDINFVARHSMYNEEDLKQKESEEDNDRKKTELDVFVARALEKATEDERIKEPTLTYLNDQGCYSVGTLLKHWSTLEEGCPAVSRSAINAELSRSVADGSVGMTDKVKRLHADASPQVLVHLNKHSKGVKKVKMDNCE